MIKDFSTVEKQIVDRLKTLAPKKIILFGSRAYGHAREDSDIDLFLVKEASDEELERLEIEAKMKLRDIIYQYGVGIDILSASDSFLKSREDPFFCIDILQKGRVLYGE